MRGALSPRKAVGVDKAMLGFLMLLTPTAPSSGQNRAGDTARHRRVSDTSAASVDPQRHKIGKPGWTGEIHVATWFFLDTSSGSPAFRDRRRMDTGLTAAGQEDITVYGQSHKRDDDWRLDLAAKNPQYEASNSDAAQPASPYPTHTSSAQQRLMSEKTDTLGLCGALGGYVQCPNLPPWHSAEQCSPASLLGDAGRRRYCACADHHGFNPFPHPKHDAGHVLSMGGFERRSK